MNEELIDHTNNPRNVGIIDNPSCSVAFGNLKCEEVIKFYIKVEENICKDIKYEYFGCGISLPYTSIVSEYIKGKHIDDVRKLVKSNKIESMINELKTRPCSVITADALKELMNKLDEII